MQEDAGIKYLKIETEIADDDKTKVKPDLLFMIEYIFPLLETGLVPHPRTWSFCLDAGPS